MRLDSLKGMGSCQVSLVRMWFSPGINSGAGSSSSESVWLPS